MHFKTGELGIDLYNQMIYHKHYSKPTEWIGLATHEAVLKGLNISAGILVGFMENQEDTLKGFRSAIENEAQG